MNKNDYDTLEKKYRRWKIATIILTVILAAMIYFYYDYTVFKILIAGNYVFTDALDEVYSQAIGDENVKGYFRDFDRMVISVVTERLRSASGDKYTYLFTPQSYKFSKEAEKADAALTEISKIDEDNVYLLIPNMSKNSRKYVLSHKDELAKYRNITIDLRDNYGGMLSDFYKIAQLFLDKGVTIGYENTRVPLFTRHIRSKGDKYLVFDNITILQNQYTASSAEGFIMALNENLDNVELRGSRTFGKGIGQVTLPLTGGYAVKATIMLVAAPDGSTIHGMGIEPDIVFQ